MATFIGFSGLAGSGKDTAADIICRHDSSCKKVAFGDAVKDVASAVFGWRRDLLQGDTEESRSFREEPDVFWSKALEKRFTPRYALQLIGTDCFREVFGEKIWTNSLLYRLKNTSEPYATYLIPDVRFPNEIDVIHRLGGKVYRIKRGTLPDWYVEAESYNKSLLKEPELELPETLWNIHASERSLAGLNLEDGTLYNNGTLEDFEKTVLEHVER